MHCTDPLSVIDIPNLIRETGDKVEITERNESRIVFLIEKATAPLLSIDPIQIDRVRYRSMRRLY